MRIGWFSALFASLSAALGAMAVPAVAADTLGQPVPWGIGLQAGASPIKHQVADFHDLLLVIITAITIFVLALLVYVMWRFRADRNPTPSKTTHNTLIEIIWTTVPVIILVIIAVPSFKLLYAEDVVPPADMTVKAIGKQWFWSYEYDVPEKGTITFDSYMLSDDEAQKAGLPRLLGVDNPMVVPVGATVRVQVTAADVIHSFALPSFGVKRDAVPGRLNETWFKAETEGDFYGQCSELCGNGHAYMPIMIRVVSADAYTKWLADAEKNFTFEPYAAPAEKQAASAQGS